MRLLKRPELKTCIIILGMHSSGTSCLTGLLQECGVYLGEVDKSNQYNIKGNRENKWIMKLNEQLLNYNQGSWKNPPVDLVWNKWHEIKRDRLIRQLSRKTQGKYCGFKDPRTLLTLPFWLAGFSDYKLFATYRHPSSVVQSLKKRKNISFDCNYGYRLWEIYNSKLLHYLQTLNVSLISFDETFKSYIDVFESIINRDFDNQIRVDESVSFYDTKLVYFKSGNIETEVPESAAELYYELQKYYSIQKML